MPQFTMYGYSTYQPSVRDAMSDVVAECARETLGVSDGSWAHRFLALDPADFRASEDRSERYTVVEVRLFAGRTLEAKKAFYAAMYEQFVAKLGIDAVDLEIILIDTERHNWAARGRPGDES
jgi:hypothetical protein